MALEIFDAMNATMARRLSQGFPEEHAMPSHALFVLRPRTTSACAAEGRASDKTKLRQSAGAGREAVSVGLTVTAVASPHRLARL